MRWQKLSTIVLAAAVIAGCASKPEKTQKEVANERWNAARAVVLSGLAQDQYQSGNLDKCRQTIDEAMGLCPNSAPLRTLSAKLAIEQGQLDTADRELQTAKQLDPTFAESYYLSGIVHQRWQKNEVAFQNYQQAAELAPNEPGYLLAQAEMLVAMDRTKDALVLLQEKLTYFENSAIIRDAMGQLLVTEREYGKAVDVLRQASVLASEDSSIREHLAMALYLNEQYREAGDVVRRLLNDEKFSKRADLFVMLGECQFQTGKLADARSSFETATNLNASAPDAWKSLAKVALQSGDLRRAELSLKKAIALDSTSSESHLLLGYVRLRQDKLTEALGEFQKASALDGKDSVSLCMIGFALEKSGKPHSAIQYYAKALQLKPGDELATKLMASIDSRE